MTAQEMKTKYDGLYDYMATSQKPAYMKAFGAVMNDMMDWAINNKPEMAEEWIGKLESIKWKNYLTTKEAENIVAVMNPKAPWSRDAWRNTLTQMGIALEESPYYNSCALWTEMNKLYSDHSTTLATKVWGKPVAEVPADAMVKAIHALAVDNLKDVDGKYNIRAYFKV